ncbi:hypothetical protein OAT83_00490 [Gammaproteobacteria bacterium]|jgi:hypothetical protein|nr:hypothetical protein [Gammaproteobacteria bacterium]MDC1331219.1 hypothetical protein [Gammaproteobacteria bacterium]
MSELENLLKEEGQDPVFESTFAVASVLKVIGVVSIILGITNLLFMFPIYGECTGRYGCEYQNVEFVLIIGIGGFLSLGISGVLFLGFSKVIEILEEIRDQKPNRQEVN